MRILHAVGARPNFMKIAPLMRELSRFPHDFQQFLVHTGQHYDATMSEVFFQQLGIPTPDANLDVGSGSHAWQTAQIMMRFEPVVLEQRPNWVVVVGDVNSTLACTLVCSKLGIKVAHVEAGLRSFDRTMPEETNRVVTDQISDLLFTPSRDADQNLIREGVAPEKIRLVGNIMIDTLVQLLPQAEGPHRLLRELGLAAGQVPTDSGPPYILVTLHRPSNVDDPETLKEIMLALTEAGRRLSVIFPVHPRTRQHIEDYGLRIPDQAVHLLEPLGYMEFLGLMRHASLVLTDSGGIQEETTFLGVPCLTLRPNTERPITISQGTNRLVTGDRVSLVNAVQEALERPKQATSIPELWDGHAAERIVKVLKECPI